MVYQGLAQAIRARYIRFRPTAWHGHISMRVELYGCEGIVHFQPESALQKFYFNVLLFTTSSHPLRIMSPMWCLRLQNTRLGKHNNSLISFKMASPQKHMVMPRYGHTRQPDIQQQALLPNRKRKKS